MLSVYEIGPRQILLNLETEDFIMSQDFSDGTYVITFDSRELQPIWGAANWRPIVLASPTSFSKWTFVKDVKSVSPNSYLIRNAQSPEFYMYVDLKSWTTHTTIRFLDHQSEQRDRPSGGRIANLVLGYLPPESDDETYRKFRFEIEVRPNSDWFYISSVGAWTPESENILGIAFIGQEQACVTVPKDKQGYYCISLAHTYWIAGESEYGVNNTHILPQSWKIERAD